MEVKYIHHMTNCGEMAVIGTGRKGRAVSFLSYLGRLRSLAPLMNFCYLFSWPHARSKQPFLFSEGIVGHLTSLKSCVQWWKRILLLFEGRSLDFGKQSSQYVCEIPRVMRDMFSAEGYELGRGGQSGGSLLFGISLPILGGRRNKLPIL